VIQLRNRGDVPVIWWIHTGISSGQAHIRPRAPLLPDSTKVPSLADLSSAVDCTVETSSFHIQQGGADGSTRVVMIVDIQTRKEG
jgi:hypothetical protein